MFYLPIQLRTRRRSISRGRGDDFEQGHRRGRDRRHRFVFILGNGQRTVCHSVHSRPERICCSYITFATQQRRIPRTGRDGCLVEGTQDNFEDRINNMKLLDKMKFVCIGIGYFYYIIIINNVSIKLNTLLAMSAV